MADTSSFTTLLHPYFNESATHIPFSLTKQFRTQFKDKQVLPFVRIPLFEYLEKNKVAEHITIEWQDKVSFVQWNNPGYETGKGDLEEFVLCGLATVTHKGISDFDVVRVTRPHYDNDSTRPSYDIAGYEYYSALVFGHETSESEVKAFLTKVAKWDETRKNSKSRALWIFDGIWTPELNLLRNDASDLMLEGQMQQRIEKDMFAFFESKERYRDLQVPWKRGLLFTGPPGNGKTRMIKILLEQAEVNRLYVKSIRKYYRPMEESIALIFKKARELQPCLLVLEDLDSLIGGHESGSLSVFLNEIDGVQNTEGVFIIASSNHPENLDTAITQRPSRFDYTHQFNPPSYTLRVKFVKNWIQKLKDCTFSFTDDVDKFAEELAKSTNNFSFAFLEELFVSSLLARARLDDLTTGEELLRQQVKLLSGQINPRKLNRMKLSYEAKYWNIEHRFNLLIAVMGLSVLVGMIGVLLIWYKQ